MSRIPKPADRTDSILLPRRDARKLLGHLVRSHHFAQTLGWRLADQSGKDVAAYRAAARERHHRGGELEIDDGATVSLSEGGAYVSAWVWVSEDEVAP